MPESENQENIHADSSFKKIDAHLPEYIKEARKQEHEPTILKDVTDYFQRRADAHKKVSREMKEEGHKKASEYYQGEADHFQRIVDSINSPEKSYAYSQIYTMREAHANYVRTRESALERLKGDERRNYLKSDFGAKYIDSRRAFAYMYDRFAFLVSEATGGQIKHVPLNLPKK